MIAHLGDRGRRRIPVVGIALDDHERRGGGARQAVGTVGHELAGTREGVAVAFDAPRIDRLGARMRQQREKIGRRARQPDLELARIDGTHAERRRRQLTGENRRGIGNRYRRLGGKCGGGGVHQAPEGIDEVGGRHRLAVRPARGFAQAEAVHETVAADRPGLGAAAGQLAARRMGQKPLADVAQHGGRLDASRLVRIERIGRAAKTPMQRAPDARMILRTRVQQQRADGDRRQHDGENEERPAAYCCHGQRAARPEWLEYQTPKDTQGADRKDRKLRIKKALTGGSGPAPVRPGTADRRLPSMAAPAPVRGTRPGTHPRPPAGSHHDPTIARREPIRETCGYTHKILPLPSARRYRARFRIAFRQDAATARRLTW